MTNKKKHLGEAWILLAVVISIIGYFHLKRSLKYTEEQHQQVSALKEARMEISTIDEALTNVSRVGALKYSDRAEKYYSELVERFKSVTAYALAHVSDKRIKDKIEEITKLNARIVKVEKKVLFFSSQGKSNESYRLLHQEAYLSDISAYEELEEEISEFIRHQEEFLQKQMRHTTLRTYSLLGVIFLFFSLSAVGFYFVLFKKKQSAMEDQLKLVNAFIQNAPVTLAILDLELRLITWSDGWIRDHRLEAQDLIGQKVWTIFPCLKDKLEEAKQVCLTGGRYHHVEEYLTDDRNQTWIRWSMRSWSGHDGKVGGYSMFTENIQQKKELEYRLEEESQKTVQQAKLIALGEMAAGIAHEINNPLSIIITTSSFIQRSLSKGKLKDEILVESMGDIDKTVVRISKIINGLRNISRDSSHDEMDFVKIEHIFDDVLSICLEKFKNHGIDFKIVDEEKLLVTELKCIRVQISQVLINLLNNSYDAIQILENKWITILLRSKNDLIEIVIADSGQFKLDAVKKIFQPFFTTKGIGKGTGLGLSISKSLIEKHGGRLYLDQEQKTTTFVIELPYSAKA